ncbi:SusC/RagA family TonB-linked outer membrane protein [Algibacter agarivorans]
MKTKFSGILTLLLAFVVQITFAQEKTISGTVSDGSGLPLPGASVIIKGTSSGTSSDFDGNYSISAKQGATLVFSFVGYTTKEIAVGASNTINVTLQEDAEALEEVVVTALGISKQKRTLGYAISEVDGEDINKAQAVNPMTALQGKITGLDVSSAPGPGATQNVIIRGISSFGNVQPMYIIDGVVITNEQNRAGDNLNSQVDFGSGINSINPNDIENITVLKGASSTALYGSRAANGVILITTKSGKSGKMKIDINSSYSINKVGFLSDTQSQFGQGWSGDRALDENGNWGAAYDGVDRVWGNIVNNSQKIKPYVYLKNNIRDFYEDGGNSKNSISLSGGNDTNTYFLSLSQNTVDGVVPTDNDSYSRYTLSTKATHKTEKFKFTSVINFSKEKTNAIPSGQGTSLNRSLREIANDISIIDLKDYNDPFNNLDNYFTPYGVNPYFILNNDGASQNKNKFFGKFEVEYNVLDDVSLMYRFSGDYETSTANTHTGIIAFTPDSYNDGASATTPGSYRQTKRNRTQTSHDIMATYNKSINENIDFSTIAGLNVNERSYDWLYGDISSIDIPGFYDLNNSLTPATSDQYREKRRLIGTYISADLSYKDFIYLNATARNDWSSTLPQGSNSFFYGGLNASFILTNLFEDTGVFDFSKLRIGYGSTGLDADVYNVADRYVTGASSSPNFPDVDDLTFPLNGVNSYTASNRLGNPNLTPEITTEFEVGIENRLFKNRLGIEFSYYNRFTDGLISQLDLDPSSGYDFIIANLGDIRNKGYEIAIDVTPIRTDNFKWTVSWNYSENKNKVEKLDVDEIQLTGFGDGNGIYAIEGMPIGQYKFTTAKMVDANGDGVLRTVVDGNGNPQQTTDPELLGKDIHEKYRMGLTNTVIWKGLSLTGTLDFRYGGHIYSGTKDYLHWTGSSVESVANDRNAFIIPNSVIDNGDGTYSENNIPVDPTALHTFYSNGGFDGDSYAVIDKSYLKLRNVTLAYSLPEKFISKLNLTSVNFSFTASNFLLWKHKDNPYIDPETTTFGNNVDAKFGEYNGNPTNEVYTVGLNIQL